MLYRILSLSGGGMRGIFQAEFLRRVADKLPKPLCRNFNLVAGASTGSIVGFGVAFDIDLNRIVDLFRQEGPAIFKRRWFAWARKGPRYSREPLEEALKKVFETRRLSDLPDDVDVAIAAADLDAAAHRIFTVLSRCGGRKDSDLTVVDTILASCAAPTYFPAVKPLGSNRTYVDGGVWANTPTLLAVLEAHARRNIRFHDMRVLSLGNGRVPLGRRRSEFNRLRTVSFGMAQSLVDLWMSTQSAAADDFVETLVGKQHMLQINPYLPEPIPLDDVRVASLEQLCALADSEASKTSELKQLLTDSNQAALSIPRLSENSPESAGSVDAAIRDQFRWNVDQQKCFCEKTIVTVDISTQGDADRVLEYHGFRTTEAMTQVPGRVKHWIQVGRLSDPTVKKISGPPNLDLELVDPKQKDPERDYEATIAFSSGAKRDPCVLNTRSLKPGEDPLTFQLRHKRIKSYALSKKQYCEMGSPNGAEPKECCRFVIRNVPTVVLLMVVRLPSNFKMQGKPSLFVGLAREEGKSDGDAEPDLQREFERYFWYDQNLNVLSVQIPYPPLNVVYRLEWEIPDVIPFSVAAVR
jgi:uncharacterized protein